MDSITEDGTKDSDNSNDENDVDEEAMYVTIVVLICNS